MHRSICIIYICVHLSSRKVFPLKPIVVSPPPPPPPPPTTTTTPSSSSSPPPSLIRKGRGKGRRRERGKEKGKKKIDGDQWAERFDLLLNIFRYLYSANSKAATDLVLFWVTCVDKFLLRSANHCRPSSFCEELELFSWRLPVPVAVRLLNWGTGNENVSLFFFLYFLPLLLFSFSFLVLPPIFFSHSWLLSKKKKKKHCFLKLN